MHRLSTVRKGVHTLYTVNIVNKVISTQVIHSTWAQSTRDAQTCAVVSGEYTCIY